MNTARFRPGHPVLRTASAAELLEERSLLSASFALDAQRLGLGGFTQVADETLAVRGSGGNYEFTLSEGVWLGTDGGGVTGAGTAVLAVSKAAVAGLAGGIDVDASAVSADVALGAADFSTLAGGLEIAGAGALTQLAGVTLTVSSLDVRAVNVSLFGAVAGGDGAVRFETSRALLLAGGSITTTTGDVVLRGHVTDAVVGDFAGVTLAGATIRTATGAVEITGRGGGGSPVRNDGVRLVGAVRGAAFVGTRIESTGLGAKAVSIHGTSGPTSPVGAGRHPTSYGVEIDAAAVLSRTGDVTVTGTWAANGTGGGVYLASDAWIESWGTGADAASINIVGRRGWLWDAGVTASFDGNLRFSGDYPTPPRILTTDGDVEIDGTGGAVGVAVGLAQIESRGVGAAAGDIRITGAGGATGVDLLAVYGDGDTVRSIDGDVTIIGARTTPSPAAGNDEGAGVVIAGRVDVGGSANVTVIGRAAEARRAVRVGRIGASDAVWSGHHAGVAVASGGVFVVGDGIEIASAGRVITETGRVTFVPWTAGREIRLGAEDSAFSLGLSSDELNRVGSRDVQVGGERAGEIWLAGPVRRKWGAGTLSLVTPEALVDGTADFSVDLAVDDLAVRAGGWVTAPVDTYGYFTPRFAAASFTADVAGRIDFTNAGSLTVGDLAADGVYITVEGQVTIKPGSTIDLARLRFPARVGGGSVLVGTSSGVILPSYPGAAVSIRSYSFAPVIGQFSGMPEGATLKTIAGKSVRVTYRGPTYWDTPNDVHIYVDADPSPADDEYRLRAGTTFTGNLLANDYDSDGDPLTVTAVFGQSFAVGQYVPLASGAAVTVAADGTLVYRTNAAFSRLRAGESAVDHFTYTVSDGQGGSATRTVSLVVYGAGRAELVGYHGGNWWATSATDAAVETRLVGAWADAAWDALRTGDVNGDGLSDAVGFLDGVWHVALGTPAGLLAPVAVPWFDAAWQDVTLADLDGDGRDDLLARAGGLWVAALSTSSAAAPSFAARSVWGEWADAVFDAVFAADADGDRRDDLVGFLDGEWWVSLSAGAYFTHGKVWARWADAAWQGLGVFDANGDGAADVYGLIGDRSYVGLSLRGPVPYLRGDGFRTETHGYWTARDWRDVRAGDFDGDGFFDDLAARDGGEWWVAAPHQQRDASQRDWYGRPYGNSAYVWGTWADTTWDAVVAGDYDGDGRTDLAGLVDGQWWVARATGEPNARFGSDGGFETRFWTLWADLPWRFLTAADLGGLPGAAVSPPSPIFTSPSTGSSTDSPSTGGSLSGGASSFGGSASFAGGGVVGSATGDAADEPLALFWSRADEDREFAGFLAAV